MSEHIIYAHPIICNALARLFTAMLKHGYVPQAFGLGVVIPILKDDSGDRAEPDNYRGITLSPIIFKLFEMCLLETFYDYMCTDDLQFGFKAKVGCRNAISVLCSSVDYYTRLGSTVNVAALDISKAFDKLNHAGLWLKLLKRNIQRYFVSVLADWYSKVFICVKWGSSLSEMFKIAAGVRKGVLSSVLFAVYADDIIVNLGLSLVVLVVILLENILVCSCMHTTYCLFLSQLLTSEK